MDMQKAEEIKEKPKKKKSGFATAGLVCGIVGTCLSFIPLLYVPAIVLGVLGAIFGLVALIKKASVGKAVAAVILAVLAVVISLMTLKSLVDAVDDLVDDVDGALSDWSDELDYMNGNKTQEILDEYLDVTFGNFEVTEGEWGDSTQLKVKIRNKGTEQKTFSVSVEAIDQNGDRIETDTVSAFDLGGGQSQEFTTFTYLTSEKIEKLKKASFRVYEASMY